jgi:hypothetical protein
MGVGFLESSGQVATCRQENIPFWVKPGPFPTTAADLVRAFMNDLCEDLNAFLYQVVEVEGFFLHADLESLKTGQGPSVSRPVALLDDRNEGGARETPRGTVRSSKGALTAHQLYIELCKMVTKKANEPRDLAQG